MRSSTKKRILIFGRSSPRTKLDIYIPENFKKDINIDSVSGDIKIDKVNINNLYCEITSGDFKANSIICENFKIKTVSGEVKVSDFNGNLDVKSTSGDVELKYSKFDNDINIRNTSGDVDVCLSQNSNFYLEAKTTSGDLDIDFPIKAEGEINKGSLKGTVKSDKNKIIITTVSGDISIKNSY